MKPEISECHSISLRAGLAAIDANSLVKAFIRNKMDYGGFILSFEDTAPRYVCKIASINAVIGPDGIELDLSFTISGEIECQTKAK